MFDFKKDRNRDFIFYLGLLALPLLQFLLPLLFPVLVK